MKGVNKLGKYYDVKEIWSKLNERLIEIDIEDSLMYSLESNGWRFFSYEYGFFSSDINRIQIIFDDEEYDSIDVYDVETINRIDNYIKNNNIHRDLIEARCAYIDFLNKNSEPDDEELSKLSQRFQITAEFYLWCKFIFNTVVETMRQVLNKCNSIINGVHEIL